ncbi:MAG TPA: spore coat protein U domain-containing protein [Usitatibacter sp.]|nr:spore coat protein U domain-containing protein [Usitatibacter sp.]
MRSILRSVLLLAAALLLPQLALAAYNCTVSSPGISAAYDPTSPSTQIVQTSFTITCTRALTDANTMNWANAANNGLHPTGGNRNRAQFGASRISYDTYRDSACANQWRSGTANDINSTLSFGGSTTASTTVSFWGCIPAGQTGLPAGTYTDTVTMTLTYGPLNSISTGTFPVSIATPAQCSLSKAPGNVVFNYVAFAGAANASTTYGVTCTSFLAYTMALDATSGTILGVNYTLALSASSATGSGVQQSYTINGNIAAGQAGTCATSTCTASQARVLTITY